MAFFFLDRFEETYFRIDMKDLEKTVEWIGYAMNNMDNTITEIVFYAPMISLPLVETW